MSINFTRVFLGVVLLLFMTAAVLPVDSPSVPSAKPQMAAPADDPGEGSEPGLAGDGGPRDGGGGTGGEPNDGDPDDFMDRDVIIVITTRLILITAMMAL